MTLPPLAEAPLIGMRERHTDSSRPAPVLPPREPRVGPWTGVRRRLAVRLDGAGDLLMTTPAIRALRARAADEHLTLLVSPAGEAVARLLPEVDEVIVYDPPWMPARADAPGALPDLEMLERLRAGSFDGATIFTVHSQSPLPAALLCHLAGIPRRLAHSHANPYGLLTDWIPEPEPDRPVRHETRRQLDLVASVGRPADEEHLSLRVPAPGVRRLRARLARAGLEAGRGFVVLHPGAAAASRRYPPERYAEVVRALARAPGLRTVIAGGIADAEAGAVIERASRGAALDWTGTLDFGELSALVTLAPLVIANNSAAAHLAAAVATPVVVVYAMTNLQHTPWMVPSRVVSADVPCAGCRRSVCPLGHHRCLLDIPPAAVAAAARDLLDERARHRTDRA